MSTIQIMGILNITPDSFSDGGSYFSVDQALSRTTQMISEGADIIDVGGESTRPGSEFITIEEEIDRVIPVISSIRKNISQTIPISIDTNKAEVAKKALENGATIVNTLGGFSFDNSLASVVAEYNCSCLMYHIKGIPKTMQQQEIVYNDVIAEIEDFFNIQITLGTAAGVQRNQYILDPGIGFGKTLQHNLEIIRRLDEFKKFNLPIAIGVSRKSHLAALLQEKLNLLSLPATDERLEATLAETAIAIEKGATIVRTHDVLQTKKFLVTLEALL